MPHLDPEELSLLALYDDWDDAVSRMHLEECPACASEFAALRRTVDAVKTTPDTSRLSVPGPQVWDGIHRELGLSASVREDPLAAAGQQGHLPPSAAAPPSNIAPPSSTAPTSNTAPTPDIAPPVDISQARAARKGRAWWQRSGTWLVAAAAAVVVALGGIWALNRPAQPLPLAEAQLTPLASFSATGSARVVEAQDGARTLEVQLSKDEAQGYQEVWLIAPDLSRLVSLGVMNADTGTFQVPAGLELSEYPIVDVSDEPVDGNPAHSSVSIVRGTLTS
jgi:anti-sigma-K factor RskA